MSFVEIKIIGGRKYKYEKTSYRIGDKVRHTTKYLGPVNPVNKQHGKKSTGRKPSVFVRHLTTQEKQELENVTRSNNAFSKDRAKIILYSAEGTRVSEICKKMQREKRSILEAIKKFNEKGLSSLQKGKTTGPKPKFTKDQRAKIIEVVNTDPRKLGKNFTTWSLPKIKQHVIENKLVDSISTEAVRYILKEGNKKYKKSRKWLYSNDPDFAKKNSKLTN